MMFIGVIAVMSGLAAAKDKRLFKFSIVDEQDLRNKWNRYDSDGNGSLDVRELSSFIKDAEIDMTCNEIASAFMALDKNFDDKITYEEFYAWWRGDEQEGGDGFSMSV